MEETSEGHLLQTLAQSRTLYSPGETGTKKLLVKSLPFEVKWSFAATHVRILFSIWYSLKCHISLWKPMKRLLLKISLKTITQFWILFSSLFKIQNVIALNIYGYKLRLNKKPQPGWQCQTRLNYLIQTFLLILFSFFK